jgi:hypothetical protein
MPFEKKSSEPDAKSSDPKATVRMKFMGPFRGTDKLVQLPIPLMAKSQKLEEELHFVRPSSKQGPAFCEVPIEWVGALLDVGGHWQVAESVTPELMTKIAEAKVVCDDKMRKFIAENELVEA